MNISKTNPIGIGLIEKRFGAFKTLKKRILDLNDSNAKANINDIDPKDFVSENKGIIVNMSVFEVDKYQKVLRVSSNIIDSCKLINIDSIKDNIDLSELNFTSLVILLDKDSSGLIKINRIGTDFTFLYLKNLNNFEDCYFDSYSFLTKEFNFFNDKPESIFVVQLIAYLYYGDITTRHIPAKTDVKLNFYTKLSNNSSIDISYVDSLWKQRINTEGFKVKGHFRLQPIGELRKKRKLIWIEEFSKDGYNRRATKEILKNPTNQ